MTTKLLYAGLAVLAFYQLYVTVRVSMSVQYSRGQKLAQAAFVWLLPFIGAVACHIFLLSDTRSSRGKDSGFIPDGGDNPPGIGTDGTHH